MIDANQPESYRYGNFAPVATEDDFDLEITGTVPEGLRGALYRNGPNPPYESFDKGYHWFGGDGMVHAFIVEDGRVAYRNRWVRTRRWELEHAAGRGLYGTLGSPVKDPSVEDVVSDGVANTNVLWHGGRLLALEEAHAPIELVERTLETVRPVDFGGKVTAHPKIDPATGEMIFCAYADDATPLSPFVSWGVVDRDGRLLKRETFEAPYCSMIHDFIVTQHYVVIPLLPLTGSMERAQSGRPAFAWEPEQQAQLGVMRRDRGVASLRWFNTSAAYFFHVMNAYEEGDRLMADVMQYDKPPLFRDTEGRMSADSGAILARWTVDLSSPESVVEQRPLTDLPGEFPRFDERFAGLPYSQGWFAGQTAQAGGQGNDTLAHIDLHTGRLDTFVVSRGDGVSEPVFVPRSVDAAEGDGWLLSCVYRAVDNVSELLIFDAQHLSAGPVATARVPRRVPYGFHGNWLPASR